MSTFKPIGDTEEPGFGPRLVLAVGFNHMEIETLSSMSRAMTKTLGLDFLPVVPASSSHENAVLGDIFDAMVLDPSAGKRGDAPTASPGEFATRAIILGGLSGKEIQAFMGGYRTLGWKAPLWAALTPASAGWTLKRLLDELSSERKAIAEAMKGK